MGIEIIRDAIDLLEKVGKAISILSNIPKKTRERYRDALDDTFLMFDSTLNMIILRLGDMLFGDARNDDQLFINELYRLDNWDEWHQIERDLRICSNLRELKSEVNSLGHSADRFMVNDWNQLINFIDNALATEGELAFTIQSILSQLSSKVSDAEKSSKELEKVKEEVRDFRKLLRKERLDLIKRQIELFAIIYR